MLLRDLDAATLGLYERLVADSANRELKQAIELRGRVGPLTAGLRGRASIVLVPGVFYADYPHTGADGAVLRRLAAQLELPFATIPVDGTDGLDGGADAINAWLRERRTSQPIVLFSLSKGSAEVRHALTKPEATQAFRRVMAWVSVSGLPFGTPSFERFLRSPLHRGLVRTVCWHKRWRLDVIRDLLRHRPAAQFALPSHLRFVQVTALPAHAHLRDRRSRWLHAELAPLGPNDGFAVLEELAALPGRVYPIWGADHYLHGVDDMAERIARLVAHVLDELER